MISHVDQYLFDLRGFHVIKGALNQGEVMRINALIDEYELDRPQANIPGYKDHFVAPLGSHAPLRDLMDHPSIWPYLAAWVGAGEEILRLDHAYFIFTEPSTPGMRIHLGGTPYVPACGYRVQNGTVRSELTVVSYVLNDVPAGQGGFACVPGSHKSNFPCPERFLDHSDGSALVGPEVKPGDAIIFTEALTHGSFEWRPDYQRRALFFKYSPLHISWMQTRWPEKLLEACTPRQRALLAAPSLVDEPHFF